MLSVAATRGEALWRNLGETDRLGGRMVSEGYLRGKVVLVDCRDYGSRDCIEPVKELQRLWSAYKTKPFVLIGSHRGEADEEKVGRIVKALGITYPVYRDAGYGKGDAKIAGGKSYFYLVDGAGKVINAGAHLRDATGLVGQALLSLKCPMNPAEHIRYLDYELKYLPGKAYLHLKEFRKKHPSAAAAYEDDWNRLKKDESVLKLAKLVETAALIKDRDPNDKKAKKVTVKDIENLIARYEPLKSDTNEFIAQEAKNSIAELKWCEAALAAAKPTKK